MSRLKRLIHELQRRRVFRVAVVYAAVAFVIWQASDFVLPALNVPDWVSSAVVVLTLLGFPIALVLAWALEITPEGVRRTEPAGAEAAAAPAIAPPAVADDIERKSIAVLPFANMSDDPENEYFSDGMTEEIINALTQLKDLRVAARTSCFAFKGKTPDLGEVGAKLKVATVLEGSVRKAGSRLRVTAQLVKVADGYHLWSERYDRELEDVFAIQDEIAGAIADKLRLELLETEKERLVEPQTGNLEAYSLYLKGRSYFHNLTPADCQLAIASYQQAINLDPDYARAYEGLARVYTMLGGAGPFHLLPPREAYPLAKAAVTKALELDDRLPQAHTTLGLVRSNHEWDWAGAERAFKRALELNPNEPDSHAWYAFHLWLMDRFDEGIACARTASALDPLMPLYESQIGFIQYCARRYDEALQNQQQVLEKYPDFYHALWIIGMTYVALGRYPEAEAAFQKVQAVIGAVPHLYVDFCELYALWDNLEEAKRYLAELLSLSKQKHVPPATVGFAYTTLGDYDEAFTWLEKAYEERDPQLRHLHLPLLDRVRSDPRFQALKRKMGRE
jgi:TolB-like protein/Flp pilus assembly protein TadD